MAGTQEHSEVLEPKSGYDSPSKMSESAQPLSPRTYSDIQSKHDSRLFPEFHSFSKLPIELRVSIWKLAIPGPRVLSAEIYQHFPLRGFGMWFIDEERQYWSYLGVRYTEGDTGEEGVTLSGLLSACQESREIVKTYTRVLAQEGVGGTWMNVEIDTLHLWSQPSIPLLEPEEEYEILESQLGDDRFFVEPLRGIERFALVAEWSKMEGNSDDFEIHRILKCCPAMKTLLFVDNMEMLYRL